MNLNRPIKVLWLASWYPNRVHPNLGEFVERHAIATRAYAQIAVLKVTEDPQAHQIEAFTETLDNQFNVRVYYPTGSRLTKPFRLFRALLRGWFLVKKEWGMPDILHFHVLYPVALLGWLLHLRYKLPFVITEHRGGYLHKEGSYRGVFMKLFTRLTVRHSAAMTVLSQYFAKAMHGHGLKTHYFLVPNVVETDVFAPPQYRQPITPVFRFVHVSWFDDRVKNVSGILRTVAVLVQKRTDFSVDLVGTGDDFEKLKTLAAELGILDKYIFLKGKLAYHEVAKAMQAAHVFVLFSNIEARPCVISEAKSVGLPIIATQTGGVEEFVGLEDGLILPIGDEAALEKAMTEMIDNYAKYDPSVIRQKVVETESYAVVGKSIWDIYFSVLNKEK